MADDPELTVTFSVDPPGMAGGTMRLPQVSRRMTRDEVMLARGTADAFALRHRFHDVETHAKYTPQGQMARDLYEAMETARCEAVGARDMPGTLGNIDAKIGAEADRRMVVGAVPAVEGTLHEPRPQRDEAGEQRHAERRRQDLPRAPRHGGGQR